MELDHYLIPYTKINPKWIEGLNGLRPGTMKVPEDRGGNKLLYTGLGDNLLDLTEKVGLYIKLRSCFCTAKESINKLKQQPVGWKKKLQIISYNPIVKIQNIQLKKKKKKKNILKWLEFKKRHG